MTASTGINIVITAKDSASPVIGKARAGLESVSRQLQVARNAFLAFQGAMGLTSGVAAMASLADQVQQVNARLRLAVDGARQFARAQQFAYQVAAQTGAPFASSGCGHRRARGAGGQARPAAVGEADQRLLASSAPINAPSMRAGLSANQPMAAKVMGYTAQDAPSTAYSAISTASQPNALDRLLRQE